MTGASHLLADAAEGQGIVRRRATEDFEVGRTLAATPGAVVYQNELMQLIQYAPTTETVARRPVLLVPPMVNKFYLFDLQPKSSFLKWLVDQGHTVFVISWANPDDGPPRQGPDRLRQGRPGRRPARDRAGHRRDARST